MEVGSGVGEIESGEGARRWSVWPMRRTRSREILRYSYCTVNDTVAKKNST
jgi:hypothetical protein